ncbi:MAG: adenylate/guanylate cyclase domain-containing protein [candidate division KSB1 bacterium]|nr:adenylate/guanylate cyclase domain-containing protein [candidate division KSB1 bacterium]
MPDSARRERARERETARVVRVFLKFFSIELLAGLLILLVAQLWALLRAGEIGVLGWRMVFRTALRPFRGPDEIAIVKVDERTARKWRAGPVVPRDSLAQLIERIELAGPKVVGMDLLLDRPSEDPAADARLREVLGKYPNLVLVSEVEPHPASPLFQEHRPDERYLPPDSAGSIVPAIGQSTFVTRRGTCYSYLPFVATDEYGICPAFATAVYLVSRGLSGDARMRSALSKSLRSRGNAIDPQVSRILRATNIGKDVPIPFVGPPGRTFQRLYPAHVIAQLDSAALRAALGGRIVLIGGSHHDARDRYRTPVDASGYTEGIEIHANILAAHLLGEQVLPPSLWSRAIACALAVGLPMFLFWRFSFLRAIGLLSGGILLYWSLGFALYVWGKPQWVPLVSPTLLAWATALGMVFYKSLRVELVQDEIERLWGPRIAHSHLMSLLEQDVSPDRLIAPGRGKHETVTVVCLGIDGLSHLLERRALREADAFRLVDAFIDTIQEKVVFAGDRRGAVDRFFGCRMLVFCGVPIAQEDRIEAIRAAEIAREAVEVFDILRTEWKRRIGEVADSLRLHVGIHTGPVIVGTILNRIGEKEYAILGETIHVAERAQERAKLLSRHPDRRVLVTDATKTLIADSFQLARAGSLRDHLVGQRGGYRLYWLLW